MEDNYEQDPVEPNVDKDQGVNKDQGLQTENREELQQLLLQLTEEKVLTRFSDLHLDRENEILHLLDGSKITVREFRQMQAFVTTELQDCGPQFERDFYRHIFRLKGWTYVEGQREKPWPVATYTNELIYGRYTKEVLPSLQQLNPYTGNGFRRYYHYQHLTAYGVQKLQEFISDAITVMKECSSWYQFRKEMFTRFGVEYQIDFFEEN
ncbi:MAG TPA: P63C domain-containing protein [Flavobacterium sp.]|nr:P63C domain-containing protein [Flavobacterium sp.]